MAQGTPADVLEVHHFDDRITWYSDVTYWPWRDGITVWDRDGREVVHADVRQHFADRVATV
jgi:hypothetical protein